MVLARLSRKRLLNGLCVCLHVHAYFFEQINDYDGDNKLYDNDMYFSLQMTSSPNINFVNNSQKILLL